MTPQEELAALNELRELELMKKESESSPIMDNLKNIGSALYKGAGSLVAGAADALAGSYDYTDAVMASNGKKPRKLDTSMPVSRALQESGYQPKTKGQKFVNAGVQGVTGAMISPGALAGPVRTAVVGGMTGLGGETAAQIPGIQGTKHEGIARVAGALTGGLTGGALTSSVGNSRKLASEMFEGTNPADVEAAKGLMAQGRMAGMPLNLDQAMGRDSNITNVVKTLVGQKEGQPIVNQLRSQPAQARKMAERVTNSLPGQVKEPLTIANESQAAATRALKDARASRTARTAPLFGMSGKAPPDVIESMAKSVRAEALSAPDTNKGKLLGDLAGVLENAQKRAKPQPTGLLDAQGNPMMAPAEAVDIQELNASFRTLLTNSKNVNLSSSAGDREAIGALGLKIGEMRDALGVVSPNFRRANALYSKISTETVDPLKKSVVGRVAGMSGELADKEAVGKILPVLARGRDPKAATSEITQFAEATKSDPTVFQNAVKTNFSNAVSDADAQVMGKQAESLPAALEQALLGNAKQRQGMKDQLVAVAKHMGAADPTSLYRGFTHAMRIMSAAAKRPGSIGVGAGELDAIARQSTVAKGLSMIGLAPGKPLARGLEGMYSTSAYRTLADNLTTPEGVAKLQQLAKLPLMGQKAQTLLATLLATQATTDKPPEVQASNPGDVDPGDHEFR